MAVGVLFEETEIGVAVVVGFEDVGASVATLGDVVRETGYDYSGDSAHGSSIDWGWFGIKLNRGLSLN